MVTWDQTLCLQLHLCQSIQHISQNNNTLKTCILLPDPTQNPSPVNDSDRFSRASQSNKSILAGPRNRVGSISRLNANQLTTETQGTQNPIWSKYPTCSLLSNQQNTGTLCSVCLTADEAGDSTWSKLYILNRSVKTGVVEGALVWDGSKRDAGEQLIAVFRQQQLVSVEELTETEQEQQKQQVEQTEQQQTRQRYQPQ